MGYSTRKFTGVPKDKTTRAYSTRQEKQVADTLKGRRVPNSGAANFTAGDVKTDKFIIECKTPMTKRKSFSIKEEWVDTAKEEAFSMGKQHWALAFQFDPESTEQIYIISEQDFKLLNNYLESEHE